MPISISGSGSLTGVNTTSLGSSWTTYTPAWTSSGTAPVLGNGTITGRYTQIGKTVFIFVKLNLGSTSTTGTGDWRFSLPVAAKNPDCIQFPATLLDNGVSWYEATVNGTYSGLTDRSSIICGTSVASATAVTASAPFTWGSGDSIQFNGSYEAEL